MICITTVTSLVAFLTKIILILTHKLLWLGEEPRKGASRGYQRARGYVL